MRRSSRKGMFETVSDIDAARNACSRDEDVDNRVLRGASMYLLTDCRRTKINATPLGTFDPNPTFGRVRALSD
jgi:hypothetical protein